MKTWPGNTAEQEQPERQQKPGADEKNEGSQQGEHAARPSDYLANERTLLAWIRTGVALIALGFVVARFGLLLRELGLRGANAAPSALGGHGSSIIGTVIILLSALLLGLSYWRYRSAVRMLDQGAYHYSKLLSVAVVAVVILIALVLAGYLLLTA